MWYCSPFWVLASLKRHPYSFVFAAYLNLCIPRTCNESFWRLSSHLVLDFPTKHVLWHIPLRIFFGILSSSSVVICLLYSSTFSIIHNTEIFIKTEIFDFFTKSLIFYLLLLTGSALGLNAEDIPHLVDRRTLTNVY